MDSQTLIAILGVLGTFIVPFIVPFIVLYIERYSENRIYIKVSSNRKKNIEGKWEGNFTDLLQGDINLGVRLELQIKVSGKKILGKGTYESKNERYVLNLEGGFRNDRFLILNYNNDDVLQFGTVLLELKPSNNKLVGKLVGFGYMSEAIIGNNIIFQKKTNN